MGFDGKKLGVRATPDYNGPRTGANLIVGEQFDVCEERINFDGVIFLKLADGRGWAFDRKPGVGEMCVRSDMPPECANRPSQDDKSPSSEKLPSGTFAPSWGTKFPSL